MTAARRDRRSARGSTRGRALVRWFRRRARPLPWRRHPDPYRTWVAEVLLQQTRVEQAAPYFERFVRRFPSVRALARASEAQVLKVWEGAGYYARARHLRSAARRVAARPGGALPRSIEELEALPGVGPYIARAIASLAFGAPVVALEANGLRVAARWSLERGDVRRSAVRRRLERRLLAELPSRSPGTFNEALMELGETICRPVAPACGRCPVAGRCRAYRELDDPATLPRRRGHAPRPLVRAAVVALEADGRWLVQPRPRRGLLGGLWEFPGGKIAPDERPPAAAARELREETGLAAPSLVPVGVVRHAYSHFAVELHVFRGRLARRVPPRNARARWLTAESFARRPRPRATEKVVALLRATAHRSGGGAPPGSGSRPGRTRASAPAAAALRRRRSPPRGTIA